MLFLLLLGAGVGYLYYVNVLAFGNQPLASDAPREVIVEPGDGFSTVLAKLRAAGITEGSDWQWRLLGKLTGNASRIQVGEYEIKPDATPNSRLAKMARGDVVQRRFTVIPGRNFRELRALLQADQQLDDEIGTMSDAEIMASYGHLYPKSIDLVPGQRVEMGQQIGLSGNTGYSTGPHLHFVVLVNRDMQMVSVPFRMKGVDVR